MAGSTAMTEQDRQSKGVFLLGVGAQKAGTSWLHQQLHHRSDADFGFLKEYHVHDALHVPELERFRHLNIQLANPRTWIKPRSWRRQRFFAQPRRYYDYFAWLLLRPRLQNLQVTLTGDITPSYALLDVPTLDSIRNNFAERGIAVKPVFLMRDPIERFISSRRMKLRKQGLRDATAEAKALRHAVAKLRERPTLRSSYASTLEALEASFGLDRCFVATFETLFTPATYDSLCQFLNIPYLEPAWQRKVNVSATANPVPDDVFATLGQHLKDDLLRTQRLVPHLDLTQLWPTSSRWCGTL